MVDRRVLNDIAPIVPADAVRNAEIDAANRAAAIQREEDARRVRDAAVVGAYTRAPDRPVVPSDVIEDRNAPQVTPDVPPAPFEAVGLDLTALRVIQQSGAELSPSTEQKVARMDEEGALIAAADSAAGGSQTGDADTTAEPNDVQSAATSAPNQASEPNQPQSPDQPSQPNQPSQPKATTATVKAESAPASPGTGVDPNNLESSTVPALRAYADQNDIDLSGADRKADIITRIEKR